MCKHEFAFDRGIFKILATASHTEFHRRMRWSHFVNRRTSAQLLEAGEERVRTDHAIGPPHAAFDAPGRSRW